MTKRMFYLRGSVLEMWNSEVVVDYGNVGIKKKVFQKGEKKFEVDVAGGDGRRGEREVEKCTVRATVPYSFAKLSIFF